jgi:LPXTG-motif cell wall-anchored protein
VADAIDSGPGAPVGLFATAGAMVLTGAGLVLWRFRRMGGPA